MLQIKLPKQDPCSTGHDFDPEGICRECGEHPSFETCSKCEGHGFYEVESDKYEVRDATCSKCHGAGRFDLEAFAMAGGR